MNNMDNEFPIFFNSKNKDKTKRTAAHNDKPVILLFNKSNVSFSNIYSVRQ